MAISPSHTTEREKMSNKQIFWSIIGAIMAVLALTWLVQGNEFFLYKVFAPAQEEVRRQTFEQSKSYRQGTVQELQNMQFEYVKANEAHKAALADLILLRAADFPEVDMPDSLRTFVRELRQNRLNQGQFK